MLDDFTMLPGRPMVRKALLATIFVLCAGSALAICVPTVYSVSGTPPPTANWTDTTFWTPNGGFPGCAPGDVAQVVPATPTTIVINSAIPNPIIGLNLNCSGCVIDIQSGGSLTIAGGASIGSGATLQVNGGTLTIANAGTVTFQPGSDFELYSGVTDIQTGGKLVLQSSGMIGWGGDLQVNGGTLDVQPGATLTADSSALLSLNSGFATGGGTITNGGTVQKNTASSMSADVILNNSGGTVATGGGTLALTGGGTGDGPFTIDSGATLDFPSSSYTMTPNGVVSGAGTLSVTGGTLSIGGVTSPSSFLMTAGTLTGAGFLPVDNFNWSGGTITGSGGTQLNGSGNGTISGADGAMLLDGRNFDVVGYMSYTATANPLTLQNGASLNVYGTFDIQADGNIGCNCAVAPSMTIAPNGLLVKSGGSGTSKLFVPTTNTATVFGNSGTLEFTGDAIHTGSFFAGSGATVAFSASNTTFNGGFIGGDGTTAFPSGSATSSAFYSVNGTTSITGGNVTFQSSGTTRDFTFTSGLLTLQSSFEMSGSGTWSGGVMDGTDTFKVAGGATLTIDAATGNPKIANIEFVNDGTVNYTAAAIPGNRLQTDSALITNNNLFDIRTDQPIEEAGSIIIIGDASATGGSEIDNSGTFRKSAGSATTSIDPDLVNDGSVEAQSGTMSFLGSYAQNSGSTTLAGGDITVATTMQLSGGVLNGAGTITGDVQNDAQVAPGDSSTTGVLDVTGNYTQGSAGLLTIKLGGPSAGQFDQLTAGGTATLDGTLTATLINSYAPADGTTFPVLTFAARSNDFATKNLPTYPVNGSITASYQPNELDLVAVVAPNANLAITKNGPAGVVSGQTVTYTVSVTNNGPSTATNVTVSDPTPAPLTFVSNSGDCSGNYPCSFASLAAGQTVTITSTYSTPAAFSGNVTNTATVSAASPADPDSSNNSASATTNVGPQANLSIIKSGTASATPGQTITYNISISNAGPSTATGVVVSDPTPAGVAFLSNSGACTTPFPCAIGSLAPGGSASITSTYTVPTSYSGATVTNTATVSSAVNDPDNSDDTAMATTTIVQQADLAITKSGPPAASPGLPITYTITVSNLGPSAAASVVVSDPTPAGLTFVSSSGACTTPFPCSIGTLNAGQQATITATFNVPAGFAGASITNTASVSSAANDTNGGNDSASVTTPVTAQADLAIVKSGPAIFDAGQDITYNITVTNNGPLTALNTFVSDPTPAGLTFASNSGDCTSAFPCAMGTLTPGQSKTIVATYHIPAGYAGTTIANTATVSSSTADLISGNNSSTSVAGLTATGADVLIIKSGPQRAAPGSTISFTIVVGNNGPATATSVVVSDPTPAGLSFVSASGACSSFPCNLGSVAPQQTKTIHASYLVQPRTGAISNTATVSSTSPDPRSSNNSSTATVSARTVVCPTHGPSLLTPAQNGSVASPASLTWSSVPNATAYALTISGGGLPPQTITTNVTSASVPLPNGVYTWVVEAIGGVGCANRASAARTFTICNPINAAPLISAVAAVTSGQAFTVRWTADAAASSYELQEASDGAFSNAAKYPKTNPPNSITKNPAPPTARIKPARANTPCGLAGPYSASLRVIAIPVPKPQEAGGDGVIVPSGSTTPVTFQVLIPGLPTGTTSFLATVDKPWLQVTPTSGLVPPDGVLLTVSTDPSTLTDGTWTGTILVVYGTSGISKTASATTPATKSVPVSVHIATPVTPVPNGAASESAVIIPSVQHTAAWRSDIRLANVSSLAQSYLVTLQGGSAKQTTLNVAPGSTTALDDILRNFYGIGALGNSDAAAGSLVIQPVDGAGKPAVSTTTAVSSRTYSPSAAGTLGQFIPATPFSAFIQRAQGSTPATILSLQHLGRPDLFAMSLGLVEAANKPASLLVTAFDAAGVKVLEVPLTLEPNSARELQSFLAEHHLTLPDGRVEVKVTDGDGRVTAYATLTDIKSGDPFYITGAPLGGAGSTRFIIPGVAAVNTSEASWRSDVRIFNSGAAPQNATATFYPSGDAAQALVRTVSIAPGQVLPLDDVVQSLFGLFSGAGTLHITTATLAPLVVTGRTFNQTASGTIGQFIPAVTPDQAVSTAGGALQLLQVEESPRYRTNIAVAEVTGKPAVAEITVTLADSKVSPKVRIPLAPFESLQLPILSSLGLGNTYNARVSVRVTEGDGKVTAYGSVIDRLSGDATYVPAQ